MSGGSGSQATLTWADLTAIRNECKAVAAAAPVLRASVVVQAEDQNWTTGDRRSEPGLPVDPQLADRARPRLRRGRSSTASAKVVVLGETVVDHLWSPGLRPGRPDRADPGGPVPGDRRARERRASRRWGRTTTTRHPSPHDVPDEDLGRARRLHQRDRDRERHRVGRDDPRAERDHEAPSRSPSPRRDRRRLLGPQPRRDGRRRNSRGRRSSPRCSRRSPPSRCSSAASAS